jgi:hypothetical protein
MPRKLNDHVSARDKLLVSLQRLTLFFASRTSRPISPATLDARRKLSPRLTTTSEKELNAWLWSFGGGRASWEIRRTALAKPPLP